MRPSQAGSARKPRPTSRITAKRLVRILAVGDADLDHRVANPRVRLVTDLDLAVGHEMHVAVEIAQTHVAQRHFLDQAALAGDLDDVALPHLVVEQQEEAVEVVLDQALRAEADRDARDAGGGEDRRDRDADLAQHQHARDEHDHDRRGVAEHPRQGLDARRSRRPALRRDM